MAIELAKMLQISHSLKKEIFLGLEEKLSLNDIKILHLMILGYFLLVNF